MVMLSLFLSRAFTGSFISAAPGSTTMAQRAGDSVAHQLFESADSGAGRDPRRAQELRDAALAFLSVVR
jgi:hypothetical protein